MNELNMMSEFKLNLMKNLLIYRAASAIQLTKLNYNKQIPSISNEKFTYSELAKLTKVGLVKMYKPQPNVYKYSLYYLTRKGHEYAQFILEIVEGEQGEGWSPGNLDSYGWFDYEVYSPPLEQINHHTMLIDFFISISINVPTTIQHRNNLYAKRKTWTNHILRMDAEVRLGNKTIAIEIDRGTESHSQLIEKFQGYLFYIKDLEAKNKEIDFKDIVFIVGNVKHREGGLKRRWLNIMSAFYKAMGEDAFKIDIHFCTTEDAYNLLNYELEHKLAFNSLANEYLPKHEKIKIKKLFRDPLSQKGFVMQDDLEKNYFVVLAHEYSTSSVRLYNQLTQTDFKCQDYFIANVDNTARFDFDLARYDVSIKVQDLFSGLSKRITENNIIQMPRVICEEFESTAKMVEYDIYN